MNYNQEYFAQLQKLVETCQIIIDRPKGSVHPKYDDYIYPLDYGYLKGTQSQDGGGIDVWCGEGSRQEVFGILVIVDGLKKDSEIKVLLGCSDAEAAVALDCSNQGDMRTFMVANKRDVK